MAHLNHWEVLEVQKIVEAAIKAERTRVCKVLEDQAREAPNVETSVALLRASRAFEHPKEVKRGGG